MAGKTLENCIGCGRFINPAKPNVLIVYGEVTNGVKKYLHASCEENWKKILANEERDSTYGVLGKAIKELRAKGLSYNMIANQLNCSKSTVCYHLATGQRLKTADRVRASRERKFLIVRTVKLVGV